MTDIIDIETVLNQLNILKKEQKKTNDRIKAHIDFIKGYMIAEKKKRLKIGKYSLTLQDRVVLNYDTKLLRDYLQRGLIPDAIVKGRTEKQVLTITKQDDIELVGNKFVLKKKDG